MKRKILLIDDERMQHHLVRQLFTRFTGEQFELEWRDTFEAGLATLLSGDFAACLLDYRLGARDGLELIRAAREAGCRVPIIFLTAETGTDVDMQAMNAGAMDYLIKGEIDVPSLERSLRYALKLGETLEELRRLATHDALTGLLNRRVFEQTLAEEVERARRFGRGFGLILCDIDHFKRVNDTHGHPAGDEVLREVAQRLKAALRNVDRVMRYGGEEFVVLVPEATLKMAREVAQRLASSVKATPIRVGDKLLPITLSLGVAIFPSDGDTGALIVLAADQALYAAKAAGRDCVKSLDQVAD
ncbi:MAG: GGDEF domain-containing response regulator [Opitutaceae bacterium]